MLLLSARTSFVSRMPLCDCLRREESLACRRSTGDVSTEKKPSRSPGLVHQLHSDVQVAADKYDQYVPSSSCSLVTMPLPCGLPEGKAASQSPPGDDNVVGVHLCLNSLGNSEFTCVQVLLR